MSARPVSDAALVRRVRWRLLAWSGGSTLAVLVLLGSLIYVAVANSLASAAIDQLRSRAELLEPRVGVLSTAPPGLPPGPAFNTIVAANPGQAGVSLVGGASAGTFAFVVGPTDAAFPDVTRLFDAQLPNVRSVEEARATGESIRCGPGPAPDSARRRSFSARRLPLAASIRFRT